MAAGDDSSVPLGTPTGNADTRLTANGDHRQVVAVGNAGDLVAGVAPWGALEINQGPRTLFYDSWSTSPVDTTDKWTVTGTSPTISAGNMTFATTAGYHAIRTKDTVRPNAGFTYVANGIKLEATAGTGQTRFFGLGTAPTVPSATSMAQEGIGFEVDAAGAVHVVSYTAGARTLLASLPSNATPTGTYANANATTVNYRDSATHRFAMYFRVTTAMFFIDNLQIPLATVNFPNVAIVELPAALAVFNATPTGTVFTNIAHLTADTSPANQIIQDPVIGTRQARVTAQGALLVDRSSAEVKTTTTPATVATASGALYNSRVAQSAITASAALVLAPGAGLSIYVTDISVSNAGGTLNTVTFMDGATVLMDIVAAASGGGGSMNFQTPLKLTANTALNYSTSAASDTRITVTGYVST